MTYRELLTALRQVEDERLDDNVSVLLPGDGEYYPIQGIFAVAPNDDQSVLDVGHLVLYTEV